MTTTVVTQQTRRRSVAWLLKRIALALVALILVGAGIFVVIGANAKAVLKAKYPPIGQMVDVGGYKLHIYCQGTGTPTVVMDAGAGNTGLYWSLVQSEIAKSVRTCMYDRAGYGWSDKSPQPRSIDTMVEELHTLLHNAKLEGTLVLVGHSLGGVIVRQLAQSHPQNVVGMVLVDSSQEKQLEYFPEEVVKASAKASAQLRRLERLIALGIPALNPSLVPLEGKLPLEAAEASRALLLSDPKHLVTLQGEVTALERGDTEPVKTLGDISLIVLSHGQFDAGAMGVSAEVAEQYGQAWQELQVELAALSSKGKRIVAEGSGHNIHLDQPELVISAIEEVLAEASE